MNSSAKSTDAWSVRRILIAGLLGTIYVAYFRAFDFWPLGFADEIRWRLDLTGPLIALVVSVILLVWLIKAFIALYRRSFRTAASVFIAILIAPAWSAMLFATPLSDPWLWYVVLDRSRFDELAADKVPLDNRHYVEIENWDVTTGIVGSSENHFVSLIYSVSDPKELVSSNPELSHLYGNFYRRDEFM